MRCSWRVILHVEPRVKKTSLGKNGQSRAQACYMPTDLHFGACRDLNVLQILQLVAAIKIGSSQCYIEKYDHS